MIIEELVARLGFEIDEKTLQKFDHSIEQIKLGVAGLGAVLATDAFALFELAHSLAESRAEMLRMSQQAGVTVETFSALKFAAGFAHLSAEELGTGLKFLNRHLYDASMNGHEAIKSFAQLGISQNQLRAVGYQADKVMMMIASRFESMPDGMKKSALALQLFGRSGVNMIPMLNKGAEGLAGIEKIAESLGLVLSKEKAEAAEELEQRFYLLSSVLRGLKNTIADGLIGTFNEILDGMTNWIIANRQMLKQNMIEFVSALAESLKFTFGIVKALAQGFSGLARMIGGVNVATRIALTLMGILAGSAILMGIGNLVLAIGSATAAIYAMDAALVWANVLTAAIPLLIGAAVVALGLIIEDVIAFFQGRNSVTQKIVDFIQGSAGTVIEYLSGLLDKVVSWLEGKIQSLLQPILDVISFLKDGNLGGALGSAVQATLGVMGMSPSNAPANPATMNQGDQVSVQAPITVNANGLPPEKAATAVERGVNTGIQDIFRQTRRATVGGLSY